MERPLWLLEEMEQEGQCRAREGAEMGGHDDRGLQQVMDKRLKVLWRFINKLIEILILPTAECGSSMWQFR